MGVRFRVWGEGALRLAGERRGAGMAAVWG